MNGWWKKFLEFWPVIIIGGGAILAAWGMIIDAKWERKALTEAITEIKNDKAGYRAQWAIVSDLKERTLRLEFERENSDRRLDTLEGN